MDQLKQTFPHISLPILALNWILQSPEVSCIIPSASKIEQVLSNVKASDFPPLNPTDFLKIKSIYEEYIKPEIHHLW